MREPALHAASIRRVVVTVRLFAVLRERAGRDAMELELPDGATTEDALAAVADEPGLAEIVGRVPLTVAVNRSYANGEQVLDDGDEIALVPPVSGGANATVHARIVDERLSQDAVTARVGSPQAGAIVTFQGTTRDVDRLDYEAYGEMALERIEQILADCVEKHGLAAAAAEHRVGAVPLGEPSVVVAVSAPHRPEAFAGAREAIDRIKAEAPIWKREVEVTAEGETASWVDGALPGDQVRPPTPSVD